MMRFKNSNLEWNVLVYDFNKKEIVNYNILYNIASELKKEIKAKRVFDKKTLAHCLKRKFMYQYWSRCEYEVIISSLHGKDDGVKIDAWRQIEMNLDRIVEYVNEKCNLNY